MAGIIEWAMGLCGLVIITIAAAVQPVVAVMCTIGWLLLIAADRIRGRGGRS